MERIKYRALVIDDEKSRNEAYHRALDESFIVSIINDIPNLTIQQIADYDIIIMDVVLGKGESSNAFYYLENFKINIPTVIVSGQWVNKKNDPSQSILRVPEFRNIIKVVNWNDISGSNYQSISEDIYSEFCKRKNLMVENKKNICTILQISDLQFGGNVSSSAINDSKRISLFLKENAIDPDLLVIAGDIADKGKKEEYEEAANWISTFATNLWGIYNVLPEDTIKNRVIIVPGNHDYDLSISASDNYEFEFYSSEKNTFSKKKEPIQFKNQKLGFFNFINFAKKLFQDYEWFNYTDEAIHYNNSFINWGINFILVNSAYNINSQNCENRFDEFYCDFSQLREQELPVNNNLGSQVKDLCNILVMHNPPSDFKSQTTNGNDSWKRLQTIIEDNRINICLYGHTHDTISPYLLGGNGGKFCKKLICIPSSSLRLNSSSLTSDSMRGFNIIELHKKDGLVNEVNFRSFEIVNASIKERIDDNTTIKL